MKKFSTAVIFLLITFSFAEAQVCTPVWVDTGYGINPDTTINLPPAYAGSAYDAVAQFKTPASTLVNGLPITIDHVVLTDVTGLSTIPASIPFYFQCNPADCSFAADSVGCVRIQGTPTLPGTYELTIQTNVYITPFFFLPFPTPGYRIVVNYPLGNADISNSKFNVSKNEPNPAVSGTNIYVTLEKTENFSVRISNVVAGAIFSAVVNGKKGINMFNIDASLFSPGIYFYTVSNGVQAVTRKMVVE